MGETSGATNTQKTVMLSLADGWMLRYVDLHGWCLFQPNRSRPFARVKKRTVDEMTARGWLTPGIATKGLGYRPAKELTGLGRKYADRLLGKKWGSEPEWDPYDQRAAKKSPKAEPASDSDSSVPLTPLSKSQIIVEPVHAANGSAHVEPAQTGPIPLNGKASDDHGEAPRFRLVA